ncbi:sporulation related protein [Balneicella halophila]|uniref:Sporulation related protein n=1 Tax=Balneicella halophila TaxID=1537566 RepID=A0A7L4UQL7_BALHA|nr:SPOR domain-containing protein [Balneicella halophila]PVX50030.1 sporulation related protein [Balneicella halophila]
MKNVFFYALLLSAFLATSCGSTKKSRTDDDFYDFNKQEPTIEEPTTTETTNDYDVAADGTYTKPSNVSSRFETVEIVRGAIDYDAKYFIILGSFANENNANRLVGTLAKQGFAPNILKADNGMYRVSGYYFNDEKAARMEVDAIRAKYPEYDDLWLLIKK